MTEPVESVPFHLKYYMFDWDDNILRMPTRIHLDRKTESGGWAPLEATTAEFARIRRDRDNYRPRENDWNKAFIDFYDIGNRGEQAFLEDTRAAVEQVLSARMAPAPSYLNFKKALIEGRLFAIISARSHGAAAIRLGVEYFIDQALTAEEKALMIRNLRAYAVYFDGTDAGRTDAQLLKNYLDLNRYRGVSSPEFQAQMGLKGGGSESPEEAKQVAIKEFVLHVIRLIKDKRVQHPVSIGFSDDDIHNVRAVEDFIREQLAREFPYIKFAVYDTSDAAIDGGRKIVISS